MNAVGPAFRNHGVYVLPEVTEWLFREDVPTKSGGTMRQTTLKVRYTFTAQDGSSVSCVVPGESADSGDKGVSKAMSVAYRIALLQVLTIPTHEADPDETSFERDRGQDEQDRPKPQRSTAAPVCKGCGEPATEKATKHDGAFWHIDCWEKADA